LSSTTPSTSSEPATPRLTVAEKATMSKRLRVGVQGSLAPETNWWRRSLEGGPGAAEDRRRRSFDEDRAARRARERRRPRRAVAGGPAGGGYGGGAGIRLSAATSVFSSSSPTGAGAAHSPLFPTSILLPQLQ
jgi:hypothetical protein